MARHTPRKPPKRTDPRTRRKGIDKNAAKGAAGTSARTPSHTIKPKPKKKTDNLFLLILLSIPLLIKKFFTAIGRGMYYIASHIADKVRNWDLSYFGEYGAIAVLGIAACVVAVAGGLVWGFTNKNAYEIYLDGVSVGIIRENPNITPESLSLTVKGAISNNTGTNVRPKGEITFEHIHAARSDFETEAAVINRLSQITQFEAELLSVTLNGEEIGVLSNMEEYNSLTDRLYAPYRKENMVIVEEGFVEDLTYTTKYGNISEITSVNEVYYYLSAQEDTELIYTVKSGDTLISIAAKHSPTTVDDIIRRNDINIEETLRIGTELRIASKRPRLSIITIEEKKYKKDVEYSTITQVNAAREPGYSEVLVRGVNGEAEVTEHITYINGVLQERRNVAEEVITAPVNQIVEVGQ